ncbi:hypothetical protein VN97_g4150 [Penicillium thymicola]|uniref:Uncharacterized protein n=1 Tax=Penicillium thymicola TaxID=293382 RepID=A0AAI9TLQ8_PENTH|nr:hypothetical protein VN97_g4150 [Penicillium thymicola]
MSARRREYVCEPVEIASGAGLNLRAHPLLGTTYYPANTHTLNLICLITTLKDMNQSECNNARSVPSVGSPVNGYIL